MQRTMPPWFANPDHGKFLNDAHLSDAEIGRVKRWVDEGAPEGNASDAPAARTFEDGWKIGKPDVIIELPVEFPVPASGTVDYTWFAADMKFAEDKWIERLEVRPSDRTVVHHALVFARAPGNSVRSGLLPGGVQSKPESAEKRSGVQNDKGSFALGNSYPPGFEMIGDYVVNGDPFVAEPDHGRLVRAGSHMLFQMHYTANGRAAKDRTRVGIVFAKTPPRFRVVNDAVINFSLVIPPGAANHEVQANAEFQHDTLISGFGPHMHVRGKAMRYELFRLEADAPEVLLDVPRYDFNWQLKYNPVAPIAVKKGDRLRVTAWYDNSPNNRFNPDTTRETRWGDQSWDEMLFGFFDFVVPADVDPTVVTGGVPQRKTPTPSAGADH